MFDQLFQDSRVLARQRDGPLAEERRLYLVRCAEQQMARTTLQDIAYHILLGATSLRLGERAGEFITREEIKVVAERWANRRATRHSSLTVNRRWRRFARYVMRWLIFLGRLQPAIAAPQPYAEQVSKFGDYMRKERGLARQTIDRCCRTAREFLALLDESGLRLDTLTIAQVDNILTQQFRERNYARVTIRGDVSCLRTFFR